MNAPGHDADARMVGAVRAILAESGRVADDRQYALEAIEQIVNGGIEQPEADERGALIGGELRRMGTQAPAPGVALTAAQRQEIDRARRVLIWDEEGIAGASGSNIETASYAIAYGRARGTITALLAVIDELAAAVSGVTLTPAQLRIVLDALADAADYRRICISQFCDDCADSAPELCADHTEADDEAAMQAYGALSGELGGSES